MSNLRKSMCVLDLTNCNCNSQPPLQSLDGYEHVVDVKYCPPVSSEGPYFDPELAKAKEAAQNTPTTHNTLQYHEIIEGKILFETDMSVL